MVEAAFLELPYPEAGVVDEDTLTEQTLALACSLPERPLVVGGCCCAHVGAVEALATRVDRLGSRLVRRARRPQHPGVVAERKPVGDAAAHAHRLGHGGRGGRGFSWAPAASTRRRRSSSRRAGCVSARRSVAPGARRRGRRLRRVRLRRARARLRRFDVHARAGRDDSRGGRGRPRRARRGTRPSPGSASRVSPRIPQNVAGLARFCRAVGL